MLDYEFRWIDWNLDKIAKHDLNVEDVEFVVKHAQRPYPQNIEDEKILVRGQTEFGNYIQVIYLVRDDGQIFVIHARPLTEKEKRRLRRRRR